MHRFSSTILEDYLASLHSQGHSNPAHNIKVMGKEKGLSSSSRGKLKRDSNYPSQINCIASPARSHAPTIWLVVMRIQTNKIIRTKSRLKLSDPSLRCKFKIRIFPKRKSSKNSRKEKTTTSLNENRFIMCVKIACKNQRKRSPHPTL